MVATEILNVYINFECDEETGNYYCRARLYTPDSGRFLSEEPTGIDGPNLYWYGINNPINFIDPTGLAVEYKNGVDPFALDIENTFLLYSIDKALNPERNDYVTAEILITVTETNRDPKRQQDYFNTGRSTAAGYIPYARIGYHVTGSAIDLRAGGVCEETLADAARRAGARTTIPYYSEGRGRIHASTRSRGAPYHPRR